MTDNLAMLACIGLYDRCGQERNVVICMLQRNYTYASKVGAVCVDTAIGSHDKFNCLMSYKSIYI